jgi:hypothetical protein
MRHWIYCAALVALSGCVGSQVREVKIPIAVPCVSQVPLRPSLLFETLPNDAPVFPQVQALLIDRERIGSYVGRLEAILEACK